MQPWTKTLALALQEPGNGSGGEQHFGALPAAPAVRGVFLPWGSGLGVSVRGSSSSGVTVQGLGLVVKTSPPGPE